MSAVAQIAPEAREYDHVAVCDLDTRYSALRLAGPASVASLSRSIALHGLLQPVTVNREGEALVVLDGFKRLRVLGDGPEVTVPVRILCLTAAQATAALVTFNRPHRGVSDLEEAWVVQSLVRDHGMLQKDVAELLGCHKSSVCRRLQLAECLDDHVVDDMRLGLVSATIARELVRLPRGNQAEVAAAIQRHGLTSRQATQLVRRLVDVTDEASTKELLDDPLRFLASTSVPKMVRDPRLSDPGDKLRRSLDLLAFQARVTDRVIHAPSTGLLVRSDVDVLRPQVRDVVSTLEAILRTLIQVVAEGDRHA